MMAEDCLRIDLFDLNQNGGCCLKPPFFYEVHELFETFHLTRGFLYD